MHLIPCRKQDAPPLWRRGGAKDGSALRCDQQLHKRSALINIHVHFTEKSSPKQILHPSLPSSAFLTFFFTVKPRRADSVVIMIKTFEALRRLVFFCPLGARE